MILFTHLLHCNIKLGLTYFQLPNADANDGDVIALIGPVGLRVDLPDAMDHICGRTIKFEHINPTSYGTLRCVLNHHIPR